MEIWPPTCHLCTKIMSYEDMRNGGRYRPFGGVTAEQPPDPEYFHKECWQNADDERIETIKSISWQGPIFNWVDKND